MTLITQHDKDDLAAGLRFIELTFEGGTSLRFPVTDEGFVVRNMTWKPR